MSYASHITSSALWGNLGSRHGPLVVDVRTDDDFSAFPQLIPSSIKYPALSVSDWAGRIPDRPIVVLCDRGLKLSQGAAAWLRLSNTSGVQVLTGGFQAWRAAGLPLLAADRVPRRHSNGSTVWVAGSDVGVGCFGCAWLVRRFVDPAATILAVPPADVIAVAERFGATVLGRNGSSSEEDRSPLPFAAMLDHLGIRTESLTVLAKIIDGTAAEPRDAPPQSAGLLAIAEGLAEIDTDRHDAIEAGLPIIDALYRWVRGSEEIDESADRNAGAPSLERGSMVQ